MLASETGIKACSSLAGGLVSLLEGLGHFARPCARVLSVAELLAILGPFPPGRGFIPEVKRAPFLGV